MAKPLLRRCSSVWAAACGICGNESRWFLRITATVMVGFQTPKLASVPGVGGRGGSPYNYRRPTANDVVQFPAETDSEYEVHAQKHLQ